MQVGRPLCACGYGRFVRFVFVRNAWSHRAPKCRGRITPPQVSVTCAECGAGFMTGRSFQRCCSRVCRDRLHRRETADRRAEAWRMRRSRRGAQLRCNYRRRDVFAADGWRRRLCGCAVRSGVPLGTPDQATIDHIWPVKGPTASGLDVRENVRTACFRCNSRRSNAAPDAWDLSPLVGSA